MNMKEFAKFFTRRYSVVHSDDEHLSSSAFAYQKTASAKDAAAVALQRSTLVDKNRRKSLNPNRSVNAAGILSSFFNERENKRGRSPKRAFLLLAIGVLAIVMGIAIKIIRPYDLIFRWKLIMAENGEIFNLWEKPPVDLYIKIYLFNITNAEAFLAGREKMNVEQVGPYVYKEIMTHENVTFNANNTMSTNPSHPLVWQEHLSEGRKEDDEVVMLNIAMLAIAHLTSDKPFFLRMALNTLFYTSKSEPIIRMTAKEFMFGYPTSLTTLGNTFLPNWIHFEKVGLIDRMYDFDSDFETFHTGVPDPSISGLYATYRGKTNLPQWKSDHCSNIELASDGTKFKSFLQPNESVKFFRKSMCRPIKLLPVGDEVTYGSLSGYRYVFEENAFDNGAINEANKCYCRNGYCQPQGLIDVTDCYYGFPISLSYPHFMGGDPGLVQNITGMLPTEDKHSSAFIIQPESGLPLSLSVKVQINMHFTNLQMFKSVSRFSHLTAPMLWFEIMLPKLPDDLNTRFNFYLNILPYIDTLGFWGGLILGIGLLFYSVTRATLSMSNFSQAQHLISDGQYSKANFLRGAKGSSVYMPCEMRLLHKNEKQTVNSDASHQHIISRSDDVAGCQNDALKQTDGSENDDVLLYREIGFDNRRQSAYALELEPALSGSESCSDEGNESDTITATLSRNSTASSSINESNENSDDSNAYKTKKSVDCADNGNLWRLEDIDSQSSAERLTCSSRLPDERKKHLRNISHV